MTSSMKTIEVDHAMLGHEWEGELEDLERFGEILGELSGVDITVSDTHNGAGESDCEIDDATWNAALEEHFDENPDAWRS